MNFTIFIIVYWIIVLTLTLAFWDTPGKVLIKQTKPSGETGDYYSYEWLYHPLMIMPIFVRGGMLITGFYFIDMYLRKVRG